MEITREIFEQQRKPRHGTANPERMRLEFWDWMVQGDGAVRLDREEWSGTGYLPHHARKAFGMDGPCNDAPIWTLDRMGASRTRLPDGRVISIAGEHEDYYDPDFCIYNDVVVFMPGGQFEIYGYPSEIFPPTDFHTATLAGNRIVTVGTVGYPTDRRPGFTPVFSLDLATYRMSEIATAGESPGWIGRHKAELVSEAMLVVREGRTFHWQGQMQIYRRNTEEYALDLDSGVWRRLTNRNWPQFVIKRADGQFLVRTEIPDLARLVPAGAVNAQSTVKKAWNRIRFVVNDVPLSTELSLSEIEVVVEGHLNQDVTTTLLEALRKNAELLLECNCVLQQR